MNDALSTSMFWVGAMFAFTPLVVAGTVIGIWWYGRRRDQDQHGSSAGRQAPTGGQ